MAATAHARPAQKPWPGASQMPSSTIEMAIGSAIPAVSLKMATGDSAANNAPAVATETSQ